jgi:hypothetical protein
LPATRSNHENGRKDKTLNNYLISISYYKNILYVVFFAFFLSSKEIKSYPIHGINEDFLACLAEIVTGNSTLLKNPIYLRSIKV